MGPTKRADFQNWPDGQPVRASSGATDQRRLRAFINALPDEAWMKDAEGRYVLANDTFLETAGRTLDEILGRTDADILGEAAAPYAESDEAALHRGERVVSEHWGVGTRAQDRRYETVKTPVADADGAVLGVVGISRDVTERYHRERRLQAAEAHYRRLTETSPYGVFVTDATGTVTEANAALGEILGRPVQEVEGAGFMGFVAPRSQESVLALVQESRPEPVREIEHWIIRPDGRERLVAVWFTTFEDAGGQAGSHGVVRDITEEREASSTLQRLADVLEASPDVVAIRDAEGRLLYTNRGSTDWGGPEAELEGWSSVLDSVHPEWARALVEETGIPTALEEGVWKGETAILDRAGGEIPISQVILVGKDEDGQVVHISTIMRDISEINRRERALQRRDAILQAVSETGVDLLRTPDFEASARAGLRRLGESTDVSRVSLLQVDWDSEASTVSLIEEWAAPGVTPMLGDPMMEGIDPQAAGMARWMSVLRDGGTVFGPVDTLPTAEQAFLEAQDIRSVAAVPVVVRGKLWGMLVFDDTATRRQWQPTEVEALRAAAGAMGAAVQRRDIEEELAKREEELRQSQKMEAVGRLAGGVAHDFNNMLTAIQGFSTLLQTVVPSGSRGREYLDEILRAADRSAALTRQLLAFSRKQVMRRKVLDLNETIRDMEGMLQRLLGETIELETELAETPCPVLLDPGQIEQVIMNLSVNARDAMPDGGRLTLGTRNTRVEPGGLATADGRIPEGEYLELQVTDSGVGMSAEDRERIFEPFYTTKNPGEGTGLGLSTVHGIVSQSGGGIVVDSEPGTGTLFRIFFPCTAEELATVPKKADRGVVEQRTGEGTILVVEDEGAVRKLITGVLEGAGYTVITANHGLGAIERSRSHDGPIDLLLTDVVMPEMGGAELADAVLATRPGCVVCYMSGYTEDEVFRSGVETDSERFIEKPFTPDELRQRVGQLLADRD